MVRGGNADDLLTKMAERFSEIGLGLEYPGTGSVKLLDDAGCAYDSTRDELFAMVVTRAHTFETPTFEWWWNDSEDICCRIRGSGASISADLFLEGNDERQRGLVVSSLRGLYKGFAKRGEAVALLVDFIGDTVLYPWGEIVAGSAPVPGRFPDQLVVPAGIGHRILAFGLAADVAATETAGGNVVFTGPYAPAEPAIVDAQSLDGL
jgi:hypothetical protein